MKQMRVGDLIVRGHELKKQAASFQMEVSEPDKIAATQIQAFEDSDLSYPPNDVMVSELPEAIRGAKRYVMGFQSIEAIGQDLKIGRIYAWDGILNQWELASYSKAGIDVFGYAAAVHTIQFWGLVRCEAARPGLRLYLSSAEPGKLVENKTRVLVGVGVANGSLFVDTLRRLREEEPSVRRAR